MVTVKTEPTPISLRVFTSPPEPRQPLRDGEPQPAPPAAARELAVRLVELIEHQREHLGRDADAGVLHRDLHRLGAWRAANGDGALFGELYGVPHQVGDDLAQALEVGHDVGEVLGAGLHHQLDPLRADAALQQRRHLFDHGLHVHRAHVHLQPARVGLGQVEHVVDEVQQVPAAHLDAVHVGPLPLAHLGLEDGAHHLQLQVAQLQRLGLFFQRASLGVQLLLDGVLLDGVLQGAPQPVGGQRPLEDVVLRAAVERRHGHLRILLPRQHHHRHRQRPHAAADGREHLQPFLVGKVEVEEDEVGA